MSEPNNNILHFSLDLEGLRVFKLEGCILASETQDPSLIAAVETVILRNTHNLEFLGKLDELQFSIIDELFGLGQSDGSVGGGDDSEEGLWLQSLHDHIARMHPGVLGCVIREDGYPSVE
jgi:hypothetical protein